MIIVTGSAGFIGSHLAKLAHGMDPHVVLVDDLKALGSRKYLGFLSGSVEHQFIDTDEFLERLPSLKPSLIVHMGAITNTGEKDVQKLSKYNTEYTRVLWNFCAEHEIPFVYASSAATYGSGDRGFSDDHAKLESLQPLNPYGQSKHVFDLWAVKQTKAPKGWWGLKFFNVYGPHEDHKARMASPIWHGYHEIATTNSMTLFRSHNPKYKDGFQERDFISVHDVTSIVEFLVQEKPRSGIYNVGTGEPRTFLDVADGLFTALEKNREINWIDTPEAFRAGYQYHTQAEMTKLRNAGYKKPFTPLRTGIMSYVHQYLFKQP